MSRLVNLRSSAMPSYKELRIPTDWMLDSGVAAKVLCQALAIVSSPSVVTYAKPSGWVGVTCLRWFVQMRLASVNLAKMYTKRVLKELDGRDAAGNDAALVAQSVRFIYRVHQVRFAALHASSFFCKPSDSLIVTEKSENPGCK
jgi:hypothetical protein